jgi:hypothetical protein
MEQQLLAILGGLHQDSKGILEVKHVVELRLCVPGQIERVESVGLITEPILTSVYLPRLVSVPESPLAINDSEFFLKAFAQAPFSRLVFNHKSVMQITEGHVVDAEDRLSIESSHLYHVAAINSDLRFALLQESV